MNHYRHFVVPLLLVSACAPTNNSMYVPSMRYTKTGAPGSTEQPAQIQPTRAAKAQRVGRADNSQSPLYRETQFDGRASLHLVDGDMRQDFRDQLPTRPRGAPELVDEKAPFGRVGGVSELGDGSDIPIYRSAEQLPPTYRDPLPLGDPGISASLWHESRGTNEIFRDFRAWQPMDIVTIVVSERSRGSHDADTLTNSRSSLEAAIENLLGLEKQTANWKRPPSLTDTITASTQNEYRGQGETTREAELTAKISAVVAEVLPSGLLRIEGEKIIAVNNEEQVMVISGLVRTRDINSNNEVNSGNIAQMRIDYYGKGTVGEVQYGGWLGRILRLVWPF